MRKLIMILAALSTLAAAKPNKSVRVVTLDKKRTIKLLGPVDAGIVDQANKLMALIDESNKPVYLFINSPGGSVAAGEVFISAMEIAKKRGVTIHCVSSIYAASMAFNIMVHCNKRYALKSTMLLYHPVRAELSGTFTAMQLDLLVQDFHKTDIGFQERLHKSSGMPLELVRETYYSEKWWKASELVKFTREDWFVIVDDIHGVDGVFHYHPGSGDQYLSPFEGGPANGRDIVPAEAD